MDRVGAQREKRINKKIQIRKYPNENRSQLCDPQNLPKTKTFIMLVKSVATPPHPIPHYSAPRAPPTPAAFPLNPLELGIFLFCLRLHHTACKYFFMDRSV